jgi:hypothetical protein
MSAATSTGEVRTHYSVEEASEHAKAWCARNPAWMRICDIPDTDQYYVKWDELSTADQKFWMSEYGYKEFAIARCKIKTGYISGKGEFFENINELPPAHNLMSVFRVGVKTANALWQSRELGGGSA